MLGVLFYPKTNPKIQMVRQKRTTEKKAAIVGEGESEFYYFSHLRDTKKYNFKLTPDLPKHTKSDYESIFKRADKLKNDGYDMVFCVIDYDTILEEKQKGNANYIQKYEKAKKELEKKDEIFIIETMPCLEYWFLLHYTTYSTRVYLSYKAVVPVLKKYLPNYDKTEKYFGTDEFRGILAAELNENAIKNAHKLWENKDDGNAGDDAPYSDMPIVFARLDTLQS